jgi:chromosome partitioning protein
MYDKRNRLSRQVATDIRQNFPHHVYEAIIPRNVRLTESPSYGQSILAYDARSHGGKAYEQLAREILAQEDNPTISTYAKDYGSGSGIKLPDSE